MGDLRIVKGNSFTTIIKVRAFTYDGAEIQDFDLKDVTKLHVLLRVNSQNKLLYEPQYEIIDDNYLKIKWSGREALGKYKLEVFGEYLSLAWRFFDKQPIVTIVNTNSEANIPSQSIISEHSYRIVPGTIAIAVGSDIDPDDFYNKTQVDNLILGVENDISTVRNIVPKDVIRTLSDVTFVGYNNNNPLFYLRSANNNMCGIMTAQDYLLLHSLPTTIDLSTKVDKVYGKLLSTNDYTTEEKNYLSTLKGNLNYIVKDIGYTGTTMATGENACANVSICGNETISWVLFSYGQSVLIVDALIHQIHNELTTDQYIYFLNRVSKRTITFTDDTRQYIQSVGSWSAVTTAYGVSATTTSVCLKLMNPLVKTNGGLYELVLPSAANNRAGVLSKDDYQLLHSLPTATSELDQRVTVLENAEPEYDLIEEDGEFYHHKSDGRVYPVSHPDISTLPSILPLRFGSSNTSIKEVLIRPSYESEIPSDAVVISAFSFNNDACVPAVCKKVDNLWTITNSEDITPDYTLILYFQHNNQYYSANSINEEVEEQQEELENI